MKRVVIIIVIIAVLAVGGYFGYKYLNKGVAPTQFRTASARRTDIVAVINATGTVVPEDVIDVGAQVNGQIATFGVDTDGKAIDYRSSVDEGTVLATIDDSLYAADVATAQAQDAQARAQVQSAHASRLQATARLEQAERDWARAQKLGPTNALAKADYDAAQSNYEQAQANVQVAEAAIGQADAGVAQAQAALLRVKRNLLYCTIKSPVGGVIIDKRVEIGQTVVASLNAPSLFLIAKDLRRMQVLVQVNEADIGSVTPGQHVAFSVDAFPYDTFQGEVRKVRLNATMTQNVVTYTVEIVTSNEDLKLLPYLTASVTFEIARREKVLAVPNAALRYTPRNAAPAADQDTPREGSTRRSTLWVLRNNHPEPLTVIAGLSDGTFTEVVTDALHEGDNVIIGDAVAGAPGGAQGVNPFAPQMFRRGGGRPANR